MILIPVRSSALRAVGYRSNALLIQFHSSETIYSFPRVPYSVFEELLAARSKGTYYNEHIRGKYH